MEAGLPHEPVLVTEVVAFATGERADLWVVVDATVGAGGHAAALLGALGPSGRVLGLDRDPAALEHAERRLSPFGDHARLVRGPYDDLEAVVAEHGWGRVDAVIYDLGVSSMQLDEAERGFSFRADAPLDMRMDPSQEITAYDIVNFYEEEELVDILFHFGEERFGRRIAAAIVAARGVKPIRTTGQLAEIVADAVPSAARRDKHPARRTFPAIRIEVNKELERLESSLPQAARVLEPGGRLVAISYHSLEDRVVKRFVNEASRDEPPRLRNLTKNPVTPSKEELISNPRASAAKLRAAERTDSPWGGDAA
ncbi:MAG: 16S rRNA (cytosine(1402)-N(4))-methyltransferase RsmH [Actinomycetota bacterium]